MKTQNKLLGLTEVKISEKVYPRMNYDWMTSYKYAQAMKAGANFPAIVVAEFRNQFILVDGRHRLEAYKQNKQTSVQCEVLKGLTENQIFVEAVKRNISNARPFSTQDKVNIALKLKNMKFTDIQISEIIRVPLDKFETFMVTRVSNSVTGEEIALKAPLRNYAGEVIPEIVQESQSIYAARNQLQIINQLIMLLETKAFVWNDTSLNKLKILRKLIKKFVLKTKGK